MELLRFIAKPQRQRLLPARTPRLPRRKWLACSPVRIPLKRASLAVRRAWFDPKALAIAAFEAPVLPGDGLSDLLLNRTFWAGFWAWFFAQFLKVRHSSRCVNAGLECILIRVRPQIFTEFYKKGVFDITAFCKSGGMPSSHSALCAVGAARDVPVPCSTV